TVLDTTPSPPALVAPTASSSALAEASPTSSTRCSASSCLAGAGGTLRTRAAPICATISRSRSKRHFPASRRRSACRRSRAAIPVTGRAQRRVPAPRVAPPVMVRGACAQARAFSPSAPPGPACHGGGEVTDKPCRTCEGAGRVRKERSLAVTIPAGVEDGTRIRLAGEGEAGARGAPAGDLYIFLSIAPHPVFS